MVRQFILVSVWCVLLSLIQAPLVLSATSSKIEGVVKDAQSGDPLPGANIILVGTGLGTSADFTGSYVIRNVLPASYTIRASYIGYGSVEIPVTIQEGVDSKQDFELPPVGLEGETVVVTAQALGQNQAINLQLSSNKIMNVVSAARIQELPDANAAESIGRLPGVSITRLGGEGTKVVIRGMEPKYNVITIDGVRMASSNSADRSTDLSMISPNMLDGIEVMKTITADQDADVLGGVVNFRTREAGGEKEGLSFDLLTQGGYTGLSNAYRKFNNYKYVASVEGRFLEQQLGVFLQLDLERRNLSSNELVGSYGPFGNTQDRYVTRSITLQNVARDRQRRNGTLNLDYRIPDGKITFSNFYSSGITSVENRQEERAVQTTSANIDQHRYTLAYDNTTVTMVTNTLGYDQQLPFFHLETKLSHTYSESSSPGNWTVEFFQQGAGLLKFLNVPNLDPRVVSDSVSTDATRAILNTLTSNNIFSKEGAWTASVDLDFPLNVSNTITSVVKFGGKYRYQTRSYANEQYGTNATLASPSARAAAIMIAEHFQIPSTIDPNHIPLSFFLDPGYDYGTFMSGEYSMANPVSFGQMGEMIRFCKANTDVFAGLGAAEAWARNNYASITGNYSGDEVLSAFYLMATMNIGPDVTIIPGIRYQNLKTTYSGTRGQSTAMSYYYYNHDTDTTTTVSHPFWLPNLNVRIRPVSWFDVRLSYSNTISYPDFFMILPRIDAPSNPDPAHPILWNNYLLAPSRSRNYDIYLSLSENTVGLFTVGAFLKRISDLIYAWQFSKVGAEAKPYYLSNKEPNANVTYHFSSYRNNPYVVESWGMEFDWQTHFWYLPDPFKGLVLNVNYTHVSSKAEYPYRATLPVYPRGTREVDTSFTDKLISQPNHIVNLSIGYDYLDFSMRLSMLYQADIFTIPSQWPQMRASTAAYKRWDVSVKQRLPWFGVQVFANVNNLNDVRDTAVLQMYPDIPMSAEAYGLTAEAGLRVQF